MTEWKIVPLDPTPEMIRDGAGEDGRATALAVWGAMLKAAPQGTFDSASKAEIARLTRELQIRTKELVNCVRQGYALGIDEGKSGCDMTARVEGYVDAAGALCITSMEVTEAGPSERSSS